MKGLSRSSEVGRLAIVLSLALAPCAYAAPDSHSPLDPREPAAVPTLRQDLMRLAGDGHEPSSTAVLQEGVGARSTATAPDAGREAEQRAPDELHAPVPSLSSQAEPALYWFLIIAAMLVLAFFAGRQRIK